MKSGRIRAIGIPAREDGMDSFGQYMNGGITAGHVLHFLMAPYVLGENERADRILRAMLERQHRGEFQNGVRDATTASAFFRLRSCARNPSGQSSARR